MPRLPVALALLAALAGGALGDEKPAAEWVPSQHFTPAEGRPVRYIVIHTIEGSYEGCLRWFQNPKSKVSAHFVVSFDGRIAQTVREEDVAWHAGVRLYNDEGIGIEHEGYAAKDGWTAREYEASARLARYLCRRYGIPVDRTHLLAHSEIAPGRKEDPGPHFDWDRYLALIRSGDETQPPARAGTPPEQKSRLAEVLERARRYEENDRLLPAHENFRWIADNFGDEDGPEVAQAREAIERILSDPVRHARIEEERIRQEIGIWMGWGKTYAGVEKYEKAREYFERVILVYPDRLESREAQRRLEAVEAKIAGDGR
ncbi:MAG: N-acetylmuramoyl-L-alanine amidase [Planctomycetes bacterium]|nr:N-acetylmuramoyl-L-alanine amidase [Planctomycetota bacterium]